MLIGIDLLEQLLEHRRRSALAAVDGEASLEVRGLRRRVEADELALRLRPIALEELGAHLGGPGVRTERQRGDVGADLLRRTHQQQPARARLGLRFARGAGQRLGAIELDPGPLRIAEEQAKARALDSGRARRNGRQLIGRARQISEGGSQRRALLAHRGRAHGEASRQLESLLGSRRISRGQRQLCDGELYVGAHRPQPGRIGHQRTRSLEHARSDPQPPRERRRASCRIGRSEPLEARPRLVGPSLEDLDPRQHDQRTHQAGRLLQRRVDLGARRSRASEAELAVGPCHAALGRRLASQQCQRLLEAAPSLYDLGQDQATVEGAALEGSSRQRLGRVEIADRSERRAKLGAKRCVCRWLERHGGQERAARGVDVLASDVELRFGQLGARLLAGRGVARPLEPSEPLQLRRRPAGTDLGAHRLGSDEQDLRRSALGGCECGARLSEATRARLGSRPRQQREGILALAGRLAQRRRRLSWLAVLEERQANEIVGAGIVEPLLALGRVAPRCIAISRGERRQTERVEGVGLICPIARRRTLRSCDRPQRLEVARTVSPIPVGRLRGHARAQRRRPRESELRQRHLQLRPRSVHELAPDLGDGHGLHGRRCPTRALPQRQVGDRRDRDQHDKEQAKATTATTNRRRVEIGARPVARQRLFLERRWRRRGRRRQRRWDVRRLARPGRTQHRLQHRLQERIDPRRRQHVGALFRQRVRVGNRHRLFVLVAGNLALGRRCRRAGDEPLLARDIDANRRIGRHLDVDLGVDLVPLRRRQPAQIEWTDRGRQRATIGRRSERHVARRDHDLGSGRESAAPILGVGLGVLGQIVGREAARRGRLGDRQLGHQVLDGVILRIERLGALEAVLGTGEVLARQHGLPPQAPYGRHRRGTGDQQVGLDEQLAPAPERRQRLREQQPRLVLELVLRSALALLLRGDEPLTADAHHVGVVASGEEGAALGYELGFLTHGEQPASIARR